MRELLFFLQVYIRKPVIWLGAIITAAVVIFSFSSPAFTEELPCAFYCADRSEEANALSDYLSKKNFVRCADEKEVYNMVRNAEADTGLIIRDDFTDSLRSYDLKDCAQIVTSDRSINTASYKLIAAAAIYQQIMPYKAASTAQQMGFDADTEDITSYEDVADTLVRPLEFEITSVTGESIDENRDIDSAVGVMSITCFVLLGMLSIAVIRRSSADVRIRFKTSLFFYRKALLPQNAAAALWIFAATAIGLAVSSALFGAPFLKLTIAFLLYIIILVCLFSAVSMLNVSSEILVIIIAVDAALSLILCPLYGQTALLLSSLRPLRFLSIPYLIYCFV